MTDIAEVIVPPNEEGTRATVLRWYKAIGDAVAKDEPLVELETDKVTVEISAPVAGRLIEVLKQPNDEVHPDEVLARLSLASAPFVGKRDAVAADAAKHLSPAVRRLLREHALAAADINGSGRNGRITAQDVARHLTGASGSPAAAATAAKSAATRPAPLE